MDNKKLEYYKNRLVEEKNKALDTMELMKINGLENGQRDETQELSVVDNHPADMGTEMFDKERYYALYTRQNAIIRDVDDAMERIREGTYGKCLECGKEIAPERLNFLPYADKCTECEREGGNNYTNVNDRPVEEDFLMHPFGRTFRDIRDDVGYDGEDAWQEADMPNKREHMERNYDDEYMEGVVEPIDNISNQQYKNSLP